MNAEETPTPPSTPPQPQRPRSAEAPQSALRTEENKLFSEELSLEEKLERELGALASTFKDLCVVPAYPRTGRPRVSSGPGPYPGPYYHDDNLLLLLGCGNLVAVVFPSAEAMPREWAELGTLVVEESPGGRLYALLRLDGPVGTYRGVGGSVDVLGEGSAVPLPRSIVEDGGRLLVYGFWTRSGGGLRRLSSEELERLVRIVDPGFRLPVERGAAQAPEARAGIQEAGGQPKPTYPRVEWRVDPDTGAETLVVVPREGAEPVALPARVKVSTKDALAESLAELMKRMFVIRSFRIGDAEPDVHCFNGVVYEPCEMKIREEMRKILPGDLKPAYVRRVESEAILKIKRDTAEELRLEPMVIAFKNKLLDWDCLLNGGGNIFTCVSDPSPERVVFHLIPHGLRLDLLEQYMRERGLTNADEVDPMDFLEKTGPKIAKAMRDWVGDKAILLLEAVGYVLYPRYDLHKAFMLVGDGANGKSTYLRLLKDIAGAGNTVSVPLQNLVGEEGRFIRAKLYRKLLNVFPDLPSRALRETGEFKALTGEDTITADRKHKDPITFVNYAKLFFSANALPEVFDQSHAFWRRWIVVEFPNRFPKDPAFYDTIKGDIEPLIVAGVLAFVKAWRRRKFSFEETEADYRHQWQYNADSVYAFLYDAEKLGVIRRNENARCEAAQLYELYAKYCRDNDRETLDKASFTKRLESLGVRKVILRARHYYRGVEILRAEWPEEGEVDALEPAG